MSEYMCNPWAALHGALYTTVELIVIGESSTEKQYRLTGRIPQQEMPMWLEVQKALNVVMDQGFGTIDISKHYFTIRNHTEIRYTWRIIFQGDSLEDHIPEIVHAVTTVKPPTPKAVVGGQVMEVALRANPRRNNPENQRGKGAHNSLTSVTGGALKKKMGL